MRMSAILLRRNTLPAAIKLRLLSTIAHPPLKKSESRTYEDFDATKHSLPTWSLTSYQSSQMSSPSPLTPALLTHLHSLAMLSPPSSADAASRLEADVVAMIQWIGKLRDVDVTGVEPLISPLQVMPHMNADGQVVNGEVTCPLRDDDVVDSGGAEKILSHAKYKYRNHFTVPKVIDHSES